MDSTRLLVFEDFDKDDDNSSDRKHEKKSKKIENEILFDEMSCSSEGDSLLSSPTTERSIESITPQKKMPEMGVTRQFSQMIETKNKEKVFVVTLKYYK